MNKFLTAFGTLAIASTAAHAGPVIVEGNPLPSERVSFADLNIGNPAGIHTLQGRIRSAAGRLCLTNNVETLPTRLDAMGCYRTAIGNAFGQMNRIVAARESGLPLVAMAITVSAAR